MADAEVDVTFVSTLWATTASPGLSELLLLWAITAAAMQQIRTTTTAVTLTATAMIVELSSSSSLFAVSWLRPEPDAKPVEPAGGGEMGAGGMGATGEVAVAVAVAVTGGRRR